MQIECGHGCAYNRQEKNTKQNCDLRSQGQRELSLSMFSKLGEDFLTERLNSFLRKHVEEIRFVKHLRDSIRKRQKTDLCQKRKKIDSIAARF